MAVAASSVAALYFVIPASATTAPIHIAGTGGDGVYIRPTPGTSGQPLGLIPEGASPDYDCYTYGENVGSVPVWFKVTYDGATGYYASKFDDSSYQSESELESKYGIPKCGAPSEASAPASSDVSQAGTGDVQTLQPANAAPTTSFDRQATVQWATAHAEDTPPAPAACTWFVSQALWQGGLNEDNEWNSSGHSAVRGRPGSDTAWRTPDFITHILSKYPNSTYHQISLTGNAVPDAQPGDVILYDWDGNTTESDWSGIDHAALVVDITSGQYPEVAEWGVYDHGPWGGATKYVKRGWTYSAKHHMWLQAEEGQANMKAYLLHIDTSS